MNGLTDYQNRQMEKMLEFLRGIDLSQEEIQMLIWLAGWEESTIDTFLSIMDKAVKASSKQTFQKCWKMDFVQICKYRGVLKKYFDIINEYVYNFDIKSCYDNYQEE